MKFKKANIPVSLVSLGVLLTAPLEAASEDETATGEELQIESETGEETSQNSKNTERVQVWGTKISTSSAPVGKDDIAQKQADHISDLLRILPGVDVGGAHSLNQKITIRSLDDQDIDVTIDGASQNSYIYHHMGNLQIHADILKSATIEVGRNSVITGGLGGAASFETKEASELLDPGETFGGFGKVGYSNNWGTSYAVTGYGKVYESIDFLAYFNHVNRVDFRVGGGEIRDENGQEVPGTDGKVRGLEGELNDYLVKSGWDISENHRVEISREVYIDEGDYSFRPDMGLATDLVISNNLNVPLTYPTEFVRETSILKYSGDLPGTAIKATVYDNTSSFQRDETGLASWMPPAATEKQGIANNQGANVLAETSFDLGLPQVLRYGGKYTEYSTSYEDKGVEVSAEKSFHASFYLEDELELHEQFHLTAGVRRDRADLDAALTKDKFTGNSFGLKADYDITDSVKTIVSSTQLFKAPEIGEVILSGGGSPDLPNPDIKAETGTNTELKLQYSEFFSDIGSFNTGATIFSTEIKDYIYDYVPVPGSQRATFKDNIGDLNVTGSEVFFSFDRTQVSVMLSYSKANSELKAFDEYALFDGARNYREQGDTTSFSFDYRFLAEALTLHWDFLNVAGLPAGKDLDSTSLDTANGKSTFVVHNISARWLPQIGDHELDLTVGVDNLFDKYMASQSSRTGTSYHPRLQSTLYLVDYEPGRTIKTTLGYRF